MTAEDTPKGNENTDKADTPTPPNRNKQYYRKARQKARKLGLSPKNDKEAARLLEERGIDIIQDEVSLLDGANEGDVAMLGDADITLNEAERLAEVHAIQRDLVRRRRVRLWFLMLRLVFFIVLPTYLVGDYYYNDATEMYETQAEFVIQKSEAAGAMGLTGLLAGTGFANSADSIVVQGYLTSREAMLRLDKEHGYRTHFQQDFIDDLQRLPTDASLEETYEFYEKYVKVGYDLSEGVIRLEVIATNPEASKIFTLALIEYAEERVDRLSQRVRKDQMQGTRAAYFEAEQAMFVARDRVLDLQTKRGVLSAEAEISSRLSIINSLELQAEDRRLSLGEILDNTQPNQIRAETLRREITRLDARVAELRLELTETTNDNLSLAAISAELQIAQTDLQTRQLMLQQSLQQVESARIEANRQVRYLSIGVSPISPDVATYPRKLENTMLAFVIFAGIYIMLSLTVSILREQVSV
ncbi:MAG: capsule biosynthesis protein [Paracoccaceae bacterium]